MASVATRPRHRPIVGGIGSIAVILLHPGSSGFERRVLPVAIHDLAGDGQGEGIGTGPALDESEEGIGGISEVGHQALPQAVAECQAGHPGSGPRRISWSPRAVATPGRARSRPYRKRVG